MSNSITPSLWSADGRIGRGSYFGVLIATGLLASIFTAVSGVSSGVAVVAVLLFLPLFWVSVCAGAKRTHDLGYSGWWQLLGLIPVVNFALGIYMLLWKGAIEENEYGISIQHNNFKSKINRPVEPAPRSLPVAAPAEAFVKSNSAVPFTSTNLSLDDDEQWAAALSEWDGSGRRIGLWARLFSENGGHENKAKAAYLAVRVVEMKAEIQREADQQLMIRREEKSQRMSTRGESERNALKIAHLSKGACPSCHHIVLMEAGSCLHCSALFGAGSMWKPYPLLREITGLERTAAIEALGAAGYVCIEGMGTWKILGSGENSAGESAVYALSAEDLVALGQLASKKRPLSLWFKGITA